MLFEEIIKTWDLEKVRNNLKLVYEENSELDLLNVLKDNSFLFYELFSRRYGNQPIFHEVAFGDVLRCDFAWLNDNSDGPEWVLVEIEKPKMDLFKKNGEPTSHLHHALEQVKSWRRYFSDSPSEKKRIFGAVVRFRYIVVAGELSKWEEESAVKWRIDHNKNSNIEIRSSDVFLKSLNILEKRPNELWSFVKRPTTLKPSKLKKYWKNYVYMDRWRKMT